MVITLIDCDGIIANFDKMFYDVLKDEFNIEFDVEQDKEWDYFNHPQVKDIKGDIWKYILNTKGLIRGLEQYDYTQDFLAKLREIGPVECVTSTVVGDYYAGERIMWLIEEAGFDRSDIHISYRKYRIKGDVFIDDKPENVAQWADAWVGRRFWDGRFPPSQIPVPVLWQSPGRPRLEVFNQDMPDERILHASDIDYVIGYLKDIGKLDVWQ